MKKFLLYLFLIFACTSCDYIPQDFHFGPNPNDGEEQEHEAEDLLEEF